MRGHVVADKNNIYVSLDILMPSVVGERKQEQQQKSSEASTGIEFKGPLLSELEQIDLHNHSQEK